MPQIYRTRDMEAAIRLMTEQNALSTVFFYNGLRKPIRPRLNLIKDIPSITARTWDPFFQSRVETWKEKRGLLLFRGTVPQASLIPETAALLLTECPIKYSVLEKFAARARREIIVFRPPSWVLHQQLVDQLYPSRDHLQALEMVINGLRGRDVDDRLAAAVRYAGLDPKEVTVFTAPEVIGLLGIDYPIFRVLMNDYMWRGHYHRFHCYTPVIEPENEALLDMYRRLESEPEVYRGERMLRFNQLDGRNQRPNIKLLSREKSVIRGTHIHIVTPGWKPVNHARYDAISQVHRADWFKMKNVLDAAPEYLG